MFKHICINTKHNLNQRLHVLFNEKECSTLKKKRHKYPTPVLNSTQTALATFKSFNGLHTMSSITTYAS